MPSSAMRQPWCNLGQAWLEVLQHQSQHIVKLQHQGMYSLYYNLDHLMRGKRSGLHLPLHQSFCKNPVHHRLWRMKQGTHLASLLLWVLKTEEWAGGRWGRQRRAHCNGKHRLQWEKRKTTYCLITWQNQIQWYKAFPREFTIYLVKFWPLT